MCWEIGLALAWGNAIAFKPFEFVQLTTLRTTSLISEAGFSPGIVNILVGYGPTVDDAMPSIGSTLVGRKMMETAVQTNLKHVILELGAKSLNSISKRCGFGPRMELRESLSLSPF